MSSAVSSGSCEALKKPTMILNLKKNMEKTWKRCWLVEKTHGIKTRYQLERKNNNLFKLKIPRCFQKEPDFFGGMVLNVFGNKAGVLEGWVLAVFEVEQD